jgi:hypothetical protein
MRKRKLKLLRVRRGKDGEFLIVRRPRRKEELQVAVHDFRPEQLEELSARLRAVLDGAGESVGEPGAEPEGDPGANPEGEPAGESASGEDVRDPAPARKKEA